MVDFDVKKPVAVAPVTKAPQEPNFNNLQDEEVDEPILVENKKRFVLFPIKYHEVGVAPSTRHAQSGLGTSHSSLTRLNTDLANVQES